MPSEMLLICSIVNMEKIYNILEPIWVWTLTYLDTYIILSSYYVLLYYILMFIFHLLQNCDSYEARLRTMGRSTSGEEEASRRRQLSPSDGDRYRYVYIYILDILFSSNHNIHKSLCGLCFWASDLLIERLL